MRWAKKLQWPIFEVEEWSQRTSGARFVVDKSVRNDGQTHCCNLFGVFCVGEVHEISLSRPVSSFHRFRVKSGLRKLVHHVHIHVCII
jgi:hypothetical protein